MAHLTPLPLVLASMAISLTTGLTTCPGFPGFCSESFPGQSCNVVCDFGRNNVPLCQDDGTWTDIPRCIEHDPGVEEQIPGTCPSIPGYCAQGFLNTRCKFDCVTGADIASICTQDGTWAPYPTCDGDRRETKDGCDGCPGPVGGARNRTAEEDIIKNTISDRRVPKIIDDNGGRKRIPSFAGNINIGVVNPEVETKQNRFFQARPTPRAASPPSLTPTPTPAPTPAPTRRTDQLISNIVNRQQQRPQPQQSEASQPLTLFDRIKNRIKDGKAKDIKKPQTTQQPTFRRPQQPPPQTFQQTQAAASSTFGVFEQVNLNLYGGQRQPNSNEQLSLTRASQRIRQQSSGFFGVFPEVNLQK